MLLNKNSENTLYIQIFMTLCELVYLVFCKMNEGYAGSKPEEHLKRAGLDVGCISRAFKLL